MVAPAPGAFGYAWISTLDVPAAIYCLDEFEGQWLVARGLEAIAGNDSERLRIRQTCQGQLSDA